MTEKSNRRVETTGSEVGVLGAPIEVGCLVVFGTKVKNGMTARLGMVIRVFPPRPKTLDLGGRATVQDVMTKKKSVRLMQHLIRLDAAAVRQDEIMEML